MEDWFVYKGGRAPADVVRVRISAGVTGIPDNAFCSCAELKEVDLSNITTIGGSAFQDCTSLKRVAVPATLRTVGPRAFASCKSLKDVDLATVEVIGEDAFRWCDSLERIVIPPTVAEIGSGAFCCCAKLKEVRSASRKGSMKEPFLSFFTRQKSTPYDASRLVETLSMGEGAFMYCRALQCVKIPLACTAVGTDAFYGCTKLKRVDLSNVTRVGVRAFHDCSSMKRIHVPSSVEEIGAGAFFGCKSLATIDLAGVKKIRAGAFKDCYALKRISMPLVHTMEQSAFEWCRSLKKIHIPPTVDEISPRAFFRCVNLEDVKLCDGLKSIGHGAFWRCSSLREIVIPSTVTQISSEAFASCEKLKEVRLREGILTIENRAFWGCRIHPSIAVPSPAYIAGPQSFYRDSLLRSGVICNTDGVFGTTIVSKCLGTMNDTEQTATLNEINSIFRMRSLMIKGQLDKIRELIFYHEVKTAGASILELAIWKANMDSRRAQGYEARQACRRSCGAYMNIIIRGVLQFFEIETVRDDYVEEAVCDFWPTAPTGNEGIDLE